MAIILKKVMNGQEKLELDSNTIIGIIGKNSLALENMLEGKDIFIINSEDNFNKKTVYDEIEAYFKEDDSFEKKCKKVLKEFSLDESFLEKKIEDLSDSERRILKYLICFISNKSIIIIDEPFLYLDYAWKKRIIALINSVVRNTRKTIMIISSNSNIIYLMCKKVLLVKSDKCYYGDVYQVFGNHELLKNYHIKEPEIVEFVNLAHDKKVKLEYVNDIRDLIKEVYKSV